MGRTRVGPIRHASTGTGSSSDHFVLTWKYPGAAPTTGPSSAPFELIYHIGIINTVYPVLSPMNPSMGGSMILHQEQSMLTYLKNFIANESGATAIEYALIASLIAVVIIGAVQIVGTKVSTVFTEVGGALK